MEGRPTGPGREDPAVIEERIRVFLEKNKEKGCRGEKDHLGRTQVFDAEGRNITFQVIGNGPSGFPPREGRGGGPGFPGSPGSPGSPNPQGDRSAVGPFGTLLMTTLEEFSRLDTDKDSSLSTEELASASGEALRKMLQDHDGDGNKCLSLAELCRGLRASEKEVHSAFFQRIVAKLDVNGDGRIEAKELDDRPPSPEILESLAAIDADADGSLSPAELEVLKGYVNLVLQKQRFTLDAQLVGKPWDQVNQLPHKARNTFFLADANQDRNLTSEEFRGYLVDTLGEIPGNIVFKQLPLPAPSPNGPFTRLAERCRQQAGAAAGQPVIGGRPTGQPSPGNVPAPNLPGRNPETAQEKALQRLIGNDRELLW